MVTWGMHFLKHPCKGFFLNFYHSINLQKIGLPSIERSIFADSTLMMNGLSITKSSCLGVKMTLLLILLSKPN
jgi:hypothetical protein